MTNNKKIIICVGAMMVFALIFGLFAKNVIVSKAAAPATPSDVVATATDPLDSGYDNSDYLTYPGIEGQPMQIAQLLLSIRNILLMFFGFWFLTWTFARMKTVLKMFYGRKRR